MDTLSEEVLSQEAQYLEELRRDSESFLRRMVEANEDLAERSAELGLRVLYDHEDDALHITIGAPPAALTEAIGDMPWLLRLDPVSLKIVGIEISGFKTRALKHPDLVERLLDLIESPEPTSGRSNSVSRAGAGFGLRPHATRGDVRRVTKRGGQYLALSTVRSPAL